LTSIPQSTGSQNKLNETITSLDQLYEGNGTSLNPYLPRWDVKIIEFAGPNIGNISLGRLTHSHKQRDSVDLMTQIINTCDPRSYIGDQGKP
jgi:hypothetical protein